MTQNDCGVSRRLAWGPSGQVVSSVERGRALAHIAQCATCREFAHDMETMTRALSRVGQTIAVPFDVQQRLNRQVSKAMRAEFTRSSSVPMVARVVLIAAALLLTFVTLRTEQPDAVGKIVERQAQLLSAPGIESNDAAVVQRWLGARVAHRVHVPVFEDARLAGAAIAIVDGAGVAVLRFQVGAAFVTYTLLPDTPIDPALPKDVAATTWRTAEHGRSSSVTWSASGTQHIWVGELPLPHLLSLAKRCAEQARMATAGVHPARPVEQDSHLRFGA